MGKNYVVICKNHKEIGTLFDRLCDYLRDNDIRGRAMKLTYTIDLLGSHDNIRFITVDQAAGYHHHELVSGGAVDNFLTDYESSKEAVRITDAMNYYL